MAQRLQIHRSKTPFIILAGLLFLTLGDAIPGPIGKTSLSLRTRIEQTLVNGFNLHTKDNPDTVMQRQLNQLDQVEKK
jgi:hypothetical protein